MKFLSMLVATACAAFGVAHAQTANTTLPECVPLNFTAKKADIASLNSVIDLAISTGLLSKQLVKLDPITVVDNRLSSIPFSVLGMDFALTPIIKALNATGIATVVPQHINITGDTGLAIALDFNGSINVDGTFSFEIAQLNKQWWQICWTDILHPKNCPPAVIDVDIGVGLNLPSVFTNANVSMVKCSPTAPAGTCTDLTVTDILLAGLSGQINDLLARILRRLNNVSLNSLAIDFDKITALNFHFHTSGSLITEIGKKLLNFSVTEINKKGDFYKVLIETVNKLAKTLLNLVLKEKLSPMLGNTCYDA